jgi:hypothetical protein
MTREEMIETACRRTLTPFQLGAFASDETWIGMLRARFGRDVVTGDRIKPEMVTAIRAEYARLAGETSQPA